METIEIDDEDIRNFYSIISSNVQKIRKNKNVSQLDLATSLGYTSGTFIGKAELLAENKHFNLEHLYKIAVALNIDIKDLFQGIDTIHFR